MKKSNLDEMQEQKMLAIEKRGFWLAFWGLLAAIAVQAFLTMDLRRVAGELVVFFCMCIYTVTACLRNGLWDRTLVPGTKTNLLVSLAAGVFLGIYLFILMNVKNASFWFSLWFSIITGAVCFLLCFALLTLCAHILKKRRTMLDGE